MDNACGKSFEQRVRELAYVFWEREGRPYGRDREHWTTAECQVRAQDKLAPAVTPAAKAAPAKRAASAARRPAAKSPRGKPSK